MRSSLVGRMGAGLGASEEAVGMRLVRLWMVVILIDMLGGLVGLNDWPLTCRTMLTSIRRLANKWQDLGLTTI